MKVKFTKMQGAGNDFVVLDCTKQPFSLNSDQLRRLADRHFGVGADQILVVEKSEVPEADFKYRIFNQDGGEVEQCGNGARCFVKFVNEKGLTDKKKITVQTMKALIEPELMDGGLVKVNMGMPSFDPSTLPFNPAGLPMREVDGIPQWAVRFQGRLWWFMVSSIGNPHATVIVEDVNEAPVRELGAFLENHPAFPRRVNVGFLEISDRGHGKIRVWERGTGETLACGTANCAAAAVTIHAGLMDSPVRIFNPGGELTLHYEGEGENIELVGPAVSVFDSEIEL